MSKVRRFFDWVLNGLPYPRAWMMAFKLAIPAYLGATVILIFEFWRSLVFGCIFTIAFITIDDKNIGNKTIGNEHVLAPFLFSAFVLFLALIWFLIMAGLYSLFLKLLWSNPPQWLRLPEFKALIIRDFGILVLSLLPIVVCFSLYVLFTTTSKKILGDFDTPRLTLRLINDLFLLRFSWLWFISAAYLYQWRIRKSAVIKRS